MPTLPPYSTYRTDSKQMMFPQATSHGNILTFTPPGFNQCLHVKFPDSRLAVCEKCKKNFKTRDMCRVRNVHTTAPWSTAYICITVDDSCTDENGKYVDKELTVRMVQWQPFCTKKPFDSKTPVCSSCKRTNRTRSFCRERHKHRHLPWCTVYVLLSALDQTDPSTVVAGASKKVDGDEEDDDEENQDDVNGDSNVGKQKKPAAKTDEEGSVGETIGSDGDGEGDDINDIAESRTFLVKVNSRGTSLHWLDLQEYDGNADPSIAPPNPTEAPPAFGTAGVPPGGDQYFSHAMGYAAQQHQNALKSHQQYFFQMQQRQQQQYAQPPWQYNMGQGETNQLGGTAGEAAAAHQKRGGAPDDSYQALQQHQWALYYGVNPETGLPGPGAAAQHPDQYQGETNGDPEEADTKRQRVV